MHEHWRGTGPRPTMKGAVLDTVVRGPVPRERWGARTMTRQPARVAWRGTGPRPTVTRAVFFTVARGPVPRYRHRQVMFLGPLGPTCL